jgi:hypothetical protein
MLKELLNNPILGLIICGFFPGLFLLFSAWRIYKKGEVTISSPFYSRQGWKKPITLKGRRVRLPIIGYSFLGVTMICIATVILLSMILD